MTQNTSLWCFWTYTYPTPTEVLAHAPSHLIVVPSCWRGESKGHTNKQILRYHYMTQVLTLLTKEVAHKKKTRPLVWSRHCVVHGNYLSQKLAGEQLAFQSSSRQEWAGRASAMYHVPCILFLPRTKAQLILSMLRETSRKYQRNCFCMWRRGAWHSHYAVQDGTHGCCAAMSGIWDLADSSRGKVIMVVGTVSWDTTINLQIPLLIRPEPLICAWC